MILAPVSGWGADDPFLVTYTHEMEELGNLEMGIKSVTGRPSDGNRFIGVAAEFEYSLTYWWTTEAYVDSQATSGMSTSFTGYRWENRFRIMRHEHWINPVFYVEYEDINGADRALVEVVGHDDAQLLVTANHIACCEKDREVEEKLILGSTFKGWTLAENLIAEKNITHAPLEFGYTVGVSRPLALAGQNRCNFCAKNIQLGAEMYGGLGTYNDFGLRRTSQYVAPVLAWTLANGMTLRVSPGIGVTGLSVPLLMRVGATYGLDDFGRSVRNLFHRQDSPATPAAAVTR